MRGIPGQPATGPTTAPGPSGTRPWPNGGSRNTRSNGPWPAMYLIPAPRTAGHHPERRSPAQRPAGRSSTLELSSSNRVLLHEHHRIGSARSRLQPQDARAGKQVEHAGAGQTRLHPVEQGLALCIGARSQAGHVGHRQPASPPCASDDAYPGRAATRAGPAAHRNARYSPPPTTTVTMTSGCTRRRSASWADSADTASMRSLWRSRKSSGRS
jgi:hypothetical protein